MAQVVIPRRATRAVAVSLLAGLLSMVLVTVTALNAQAVGEAWGDCSAVGSAGTLAYDVNGDGLPDICGALEGGVVLTPANAPGAAVSSTGVQLARGGGLTLCGGAECIGVAMLSLYAAKLGWETIWEWASDGLELFPDGSYQGGDGVIQQPCVDVALPAIGTTFPNAKLTFTKTGQSHTNGTCYFSWGADMIFKEPATGLLWRCSAATGSAGINSLSNTTPWQWGPYGAGNTCMSSPVKDTLQLVYVKISRYGVGQNYGYGGINTAPESGNVPGTPRQFRARTSCTYSDGVNTPTTTTLERVHIDAVKVPGCPAPAAGSTRTAGSVAVATHVAVNDAWVTIESYDLDGAEDPANVSDYPQCYVLEGGKQVNICATAVRVDGELCQPGIAYPSGSPCYGWTEIRRDSPERVKCYMGPYVMPDSHCNFLERAHQGIVVPSRTADLDGNPDTWTPNAQPNPNTSPSPTPTVTQTVTASPSSTADPSSTATATASPSPTGGTGTDPGTGGGTAGAPSPTDTAGNQCWPTGWAAFNPAEWVLQPIRCAFIPSPAATAARATEVQTKLQASGPGPVIAAIGDNFQLLSGSGCAGVPVTFSAGGVSETMRFGAACSGPMATVAGYSYAATSVVVIVGGGLAIARALSSAFGLSFSMGRGGSDEA